MKRGRGRRQKIRLFPRIKEENDSKKTQQRNGGGTIELGAELGDVDGGAGLVEDHDDDIVSNVPWKKIIRGL